jgi:hypothetical protein
MLVPLFHRVHHSLSTPGWEYGIPVLSPRNRTVGNMRMVRLPTPNVRGIWPPIARTVDVAKGQLQAAKSRMIVCPSV